MNNKNCPNCGAPYDLDLNKCAYCDTSYFDLSCIPLNEPFYLKLNLGTKEKPQTIMQKVYTTGATISNKPEYQSIVGFSGETRICQMNTPTEYELSFVSLYDL